MSEMSDIQVVIVALFVMNIVLLIGVIALLCSVNGKWWR